MEKKIYLHFIILGFIYAVYNGLFIKITLITSDFSSKSSSNESVQNPHNSGLSTVEGLEFISIFIFSALILRYKYFINHIISVSVFLIICISMDIITDNFPYVIKIGALYIILTMIQKLVDGVSYVFQKYMMDILYHPFWSVGFGLGVVEKKKKIFLFFIPILIMALAVGKEKSIEYDNKILIEFYKYFEKVSLWRIILKQLLNYILNFIINLLRYLTIFYLNPEYLIKNILVSRSDKRGGEIFFGIILYYIFDDIILFYLII